MRPLELQGLWHQGPTDSSPLREEPVAWRGVAWRPPVYRHFVTVEFSQPRCRWIPVRHSLVGLHSRAGTKYARMYVCMYFAGKCEVDAVADAEGCFLPPAGRCGGVRADATSSCFY